MSLNRCIKSETEGRTDVLHLILAWILEGSFSLEGIVFVLAIMCGLIGLSVLSLSCATLALILVRNQLHSSFSPQELSYSDRISAIVRHLEADQEDLRNFLIQCKAGHLTLKLQGDRTGAANIRWLNLLLAKLWPLSEIEVVELLDQMGISRRGQGFQVAGFKVFVDHFSLGNRPPAVAHIDVGDKRHTNRDEIRIDLRLAYNGNCRFTFSHPITGLHGLKVGLKDVHFDGDVRVVLRPLINDVPLVGGIVFSFVKTPVIDFNGVSLLNVIDNRLVKNSIETIVTGLMVQPNKLYITMTENKEMQRKIILPDLMGVTYVHVMRCRSLKPTRWTNIRPIVDPVLLIRVAETFFRTETRRDDSNPVWFFTRSAPFTDLSETVSIQVFDRNTRDRNDLMGEFILPFDKMFANDLINGRRIWTKIDRESVSSLELQIACVPVTRQKSTLEQTLVQKNELPIDFPVAVISLYIHNIRTYPGIEANGKVVPFILIKYGGQSHCSRPFGDNVNNMPRKVNDGCHFMTSNDPRKELLHIMVLNGKKISPSSASSSSKPVYSRDQVLGSRSLELSGIVESENMRKEVMFNLYRGNRPVLKISMFLSISAVGITDPLVYNLQSDDVLLWH